MHSGYDMEKSCWICPGCPGTNTVGQQFQQSLGSLRACTWGVAGFVWNFNLLCSEGGEKTSAYSDLL